jgi:hypothetical protein
MRRTHKALATLALGLALVGATTATAAATPPTETPDQADQVARKALYQSELERTLARHRALGAITDQPTIAAQPATRIDPATPSPGVDVVATLLVGLVGGLLGGAAAMLGWTATTRRRRPGPPPAPPATNSRPFTSHARRPKEVQDVGHR